MQPTGWGAFGVSIRRRRYHARSSRYYVFNAVFTEARMTIEGQQKGKGSSGAVKQYPVRDFFRRPDKHGFTLAPDGRHLSFLARRSGRQNIFVQGIDADGAPLGEPRPLTDET